MISFSLADSNGVTWYCYPYLGGLVMSTDSPVPGSGAWDEHGYVKHDLLTSQSADSSGIEYFEMENPDGATRYLYPHVDGSLIITDEEPA